MITLYLPAATDVVRIYYCSAGSDETGSFGNYGLISEHAFVADDPDVVITRDERRGKCQAGWRELERATVKPVAIPTAIIRKIAPRGIGARNFRKTS